MDRGLHIKYLVNIDIDKIKWDNCIEKSVNGLIYPYSFYLDCMAKNWDALVVNDYECVMPLTGGRKYGVNYLFQPPFTAHLGVFSIGALSGQELVTQFVASIPKKFKFIEISLNHQNPWPKSDPHFHSRTNYVLSLEEPYSKLHDNFRENHRRNIQKAQASGCKLIRNIPVTNIIHLNRQQMKGKSNISDDDYEKFGKLYEILSDQRMAETYGIVDSKNNLLSSCVFFFSHGRAYYVLAGNHPEGRNVGASHALINGFIEEHSGKKMILDFEGSDIESLGMFYNGFGANRETYPAIRWNRLPWPFKWMK